MEGCRFCAVLFYADNKENTVFAEDTRYAAMTGKTGMVCFASLAGRPGKGVLRWKRYGYPCVIW